MQGARFLVAAALICGASTPVFAVEGPAAAGPIGGTDIRSAVLPAPGRNSPSSVRAAAERRPSENPAARVACERGFGCRRT
jgi:hypothetical protein